MLRIAVGSFVHEANTFTTERADRADVEAHYCVTGDEVIAGAARFDTAISGFLAVSEAADVEWVPLMSAGLPGGAGMLTGAAFEWLRTTLTDRLATASPLDACLLSIAGGMVVDRDGMEDGDGLLLAAVRDALGPGCRLGVALDMHANLTDQMVAAADVMLAYQTFPPHWDKHETGAEVARLVLAAIGGQTDPVMALAKPPMLLQPERQDTRRPPMSEVLALAREEARRPGVLAVSLLPGFAWGDVPGAGASVLALADGDAALAERAAGAVATRWFERRSQFAFPLVPVEEAVRRALASTAEQPVLLCDHADNVGAGGAGDATQVLAHLLERGAVDVAYAVLCDPDAVARCVQAGVGNRVALQLGGRRDPAHSAPLAVTGRVRVISDGAYRNVGPLWTGSAGSLGRAVVLGLDGVDVVVSERPNGAFDPGVFTSVGIDPFAKRALVVKSAVFAPRAYEGRVADVIVVDGDGWATSNFMRLPYTKVRRPIHPLDRDASYDGAARAFPAHDRARGRLDGGAGRP
jgi:microcystin degradation protein MlrC